MELKLKDDDIRAILLDWALGKFPGVKFNTVEWAGYSYSREAVLSREEPATELKAVA